AGQRGARDELLHAEAGPSERIRREVVALDAFVDGRDGAGRLGGDGQREQRGAEEGKGGGSHERYMTFAAGGFLFTAPAPASDTGSAFQPGFSSWPSPAPRSPRSVKPPRSSSVARPPCILGAGARYHAPMLRVLGCLSLALLGAGVPAQAKPRLDERVAKAL